MPPKRQGKYLIKQNSKKPKFITAQQVKSYVNKTLLRKPLSKERKWFQTGVAGIVLTPGAPYAINPFYWLAQGTQQDQRVGLDINSVNIYVKATYTHWGQSAGAAALSASSTGRVILLANPTQWHTASSTTISPITGGIGTNLLVGDIFMDSGLDRCTGSYLNKDRYKVLKDTGPITTNSGFPPNNATTGQRRIVKFNTKLGDLRFQANGAQSYLRDDNVYLLIVADHDVIPGGPNATDAVGLMSINYLVTYLDS